jgi:hypothetical protein
MKRSPKDPPYRALADIAADIPPAPKPPWRFPKWAVFPVQLVAATVFVCTLLGGCGFVMQTNCNTYHESSPLWCKQPKVIGKVHMECKGNDCVIEQR